MLPAYQFQLPDALRQTQPFFNALAGFYQGLDRKAQRDAMVESLARTPGIGLAQAESLSRTPDVAKNVLAQYMDPMLGMRKNQLEQQMTLAQSAEGRASALHPLQLKNTQASIDLNRQQLSQARNQSPEGRAAMAERYGIAPGTPAYQQFVLSGQLSRPDPMDEFIMNRLRGQGQPQPMPMPMPAQPQGGLQLQSAPAPAPQQDPNLIQAQASMPQAQQPQQRPQPMVNLPGMGQVPMDIAEMMALKAARDKNQPMADLINQAIGKVPKALQDNVGQKIIDARDQVARLDEIERTFDPKFQTWEESIRQTGLGFMDSVAGLRGKITPEQRADMDRYVTYRQNAFDNMNRYIKEMTGAAMSELEAVRLRKAIPDPEKDGPQQFQSKMRNAIRQSKMVAARYAFTQRNGLNWQDLPLDQMPTIVQQRTDSLQQQFQQQGFNPQAIPGIVQRKLKEEFGI